MSQSLSNTLVRLVFSTKERKPLLTDSYRDEIHAYLLTILKNVGCPIVAINSVEDHVHILFSLNRSKSIAGVVKELKQSSSKWLKTKPGMETFSWQGGYGAFSVSESLKGKVVTYIKNQKEHHRKVSYQDELREFLEKNGLRYDEQYLWD